MPGGQRHHRRLQPRPERARRAICSGNRALVRARQCRQRNWCVRCSVQITLIGGSSATWWRPNRPLGLPLLGSELATAPAARIRIVIDDLIDLILGPQLATRTPMPRLPASLALLALPAHQLLRLRARLRPPLRPRLRRIRRRRLGTRARVLTRLRLQPLKPLLVLLNPRGEIENELNTRLPARVIDRLRLGAVHTRKIRCTNQESLPRPRRLNA